MKKIKLTIVSLVSVLSLMMPLAFGSTVYASPTNLTCSFLDGEIPSTTTDGCDLALTKQVSVNGGNFSEAGSSSAAVASTVGDTVTWKITVTDMSEAGHTPFGLVTVHENLPGNVTVTNAAASTGTYSDSDWTFTVNNDVLPATLTITTTANETGLAENTVAFSDYNPNNSGEEGSEGLCTDPPYVDSNAANNSSSAFSLISAKVVVSTTTTTKPTLVNTGASPIVEMTAAAALTLAGLATLHFETLRREFLKLKKNLSVKIG